jgi:hypothetical protein
MSEWGQEVTEETPCARCGRPKDEHILVNATDGVVVGQFVLLCPTATYNPVFTPQPRPRKR